MKKEWLADNVTKVGTPKINVITKISQWEKYEYVEINGFKFIEGSSIKQGNELFTFQTINNIDVLIDLLVLKNQLQVQYTSDEKVISDNITKNDIKNIIKFCKRHGLPQWGLPPIRNCCLNNCDENLHSYNEDSEDNELIAKLEAKGYVVTKGIARTTMLRDISSLADKNYLYIPSFIRALRWLKTDFLTIVAIHNLEEDANIKPLLIKDDYKEIVNIRKNFSFDLYMPFLNPFVTYWNDEKKGLFLNCENLIHLSVYYLCTIYQTGKCSGGYIKICKLCGEPFVASSANKKYCGTSDKWGCTRGLFYERNKRRNKNQKNKKPL